jgi:DNA-binding NarL/FixJ family response regulator
VIRVLVVDDHALVRAGFVLVLRSDPEMEVVGEACDGLEAVAKAAELEPDVILMDIRMPKLDGIEATRRIMERRRGTHVLVLTTYDLDEYVYEALKAGASGFLLKDEPPERLLLGIRAAAAGDALLAPSITRRLIEEFVQRERPAESPALATLTPRELEVLRLVSRGLSNQEIANELVVTEATVKTHVARVLSKLELRDRVQAVVFAYEHRLGAT